MHAVELQSGHFDLLIEFRLRPPTVWQMSTDSVHTTASRADAPRYDVVLLDLDGTLIDSEPGILRSLRHGIDAIGMEQPEDDAMSVFLGPPLHVSLVETFGRDPKDIEVFFAAYCQMYFHAAEYEFEVYPGVSELIATLTDSKVRLILATAKPHESASRILEHAGLRQDFEYVAGSQADGSRQDKAEVLAHLFQALDIDPGRHRCVMVGDRDVDFLAAQAHGIDWIAVHWGFAPPGELDALPATHRAHTAQDVADFILGSDCQV